MDALPRWLPVQAQQGAIHLGAAIPVDAPGQPLLGHGGEIQLHQHARGIPVRLGQQSPL
jgi:hypothetical protein